MAQAGSCKLLVAVVVALLCLASSAAAVMLQHCLGTRKGTLHSPAAIGSSSAAAFVQLLLIFGVPSPTA